MTVQPIPSVSPKRRTGRLLLVVGIAIGVLFCLLLLALDNGGSILKVTRRHMAFAQALEIQNVDSRPVEIIGVTVNGRQDCSVTMPPNTPFKLLTGDTQSVYTACNIVNTTIQTDRGTWTFSFN